MMIGAIIHNDNDIYMSMMSIVIPDYLETIDIFVILTYTENNKMIPERMAASSYLTAQELSSSNESAQGSRKPDFGG